MSEPMFHSYAGAYRPAADRRSGRIDRLIGRIPWARVRAAARWLRRPSSRWARLPAALLLVLGGLLSFLPLLGLWMLPLGVILLAEDVPAVRRLVERALDWLERRRPHWFEPPRAGQPPR